MKILLATYTLRGGGIESMVTALANELSSRHQVTVATLHAPTDGDFRSRLLPQVKVVDFGKKRSWHVPRAIRRLTHYIVENDFDVVHIHGEFYYYIPALVMRRTRRITFIYTVHNDARRENGRWNRLFTPLKRRFFSSGRLHAVVLSPASKKSFEAYYGEDVPAALIPNGIPTVEVAREKYPADCGRLTFVCPARICAQKNQLSLVRAFRAMRQEGCDVDLILAGPVEDRAMMEAIRPLLDSHIIYIGVADDVTSLLASASALILPSVYEGLPVTVLEAFSVGCPVVCTPVGGMADVVTDGREGLVIPTPEPEDIAATVRRFLMLRSEKVESMRLASHAASAPYAIAACASAYENLYLGLF